MMISVKARILASLVLIGLYVPATLASSDPGVISDPFEAPAEIPVVKTSSERSSPVENSDVNRLADEVNRTSQAECAQNCRGPGFGERPDLSLRPSRRAQFWCLSAILVDLAPRYRLSRHSETEQAAEAQFRCLSLRPHFPDEVAKKRLATMVPTHDLKEREKEELFISKTAMYLKPADDSLRIHLARLLKEGSPSLRLSGLTCLEGNHARASASASAPGDRCRGGHFGLSGFRSRHRRHPRTQWRRANSLGSQSRASSDADPLRVL